MQIQDKYLWLTLSDLKRLGVYRAYEHWVIRGTEGVIYSGSGQAKMVRYDSIPVESRMKMPCEADLLLEAYKEGFLSDAKATEEDIALYRDALLSLMKSEREMEKKARELALAKAIMEVIVKYAKGRQYRAMGMNSSIQFFEWILPVVSSFHIEGLKGIKTGVSLRKKAYSYEKNGYESLINARYGNDNPLKVLPEVQSLLGEVYAQTAFGNTRIQYELNNRIAESGHDLHVSETTVRRYINDTAFQYAYYGEKHGQKAWNNKFDPIIWRKPPSAANMLWLIDGTPIEVYFRARKNTGEWTLKRMYLVVVLDAYAWKVVGYSLGDKETHEMIKTAVKGALIWGNYAKPHQFGYDGAISGELEEWLRSISGHAFSAQIGNARAKVIEPFFMHLFESKCKEWVNFSGLGIRSKKQTSALNDEFLKKNIDKVPERAQAIAQIAQIIADWNGDRRSAGPARNRHILTADNKKERVSPEQAHAMSTNRTPQSYLSFPRQVEICWEWKISRSGKEIERQPYIYSNGGVGIMVEGTEIHYKVPNDTELYMRVIQRTLYVKYLPGDTSRVFLYAEDTPIALAYQAWEAPMALADRTEGDGEKIHKENDFRKQLKTLAKEKRKKGKEVAETVFNTNDIQKSWSDMNPVQESEADYPESDTEDAEGVSKALFANKQRRYKEDINEAEDLMKDLYHVKEEDLLGQSL